LATKQSQLGLPGAASTGSKARGGGRAVKDRGATNSSRATAGVASCEKKKKTKMFCTRPPHKRKGIPVNRYKEETCGTTYTNKRIDALNYWSRL